MGLPRVLPLYHPSGIPGGCFRTITGPMTNKIAIYLAVLILLALGYDGYRHDWDNLIFLARKGDDLIEWLAFWR